MIAELSNVHQSRFAAVARLYGEKGLLNFKKSHICIIGVGGVGSWIVESLVRSAIGELTLIDFDKIAESNINRQIHALTETLGKAKTDVLAERVAQINPFCRVHCIKEPVTPENAEKLLKIADFDYVIDAIDDIPAKAALIAHCRNTKKPIVTLGGAGGKTDPTKISVCDLNRTKQDPLLAGLRRYLRANYNFPKGAKAKFGVDAVSSVEPLAKPENGSSGFGTSMAVTASFGLNASAYVLRKLADV